MKKTFTAALTLAASLLMVGSALAQQPGVRHAPPEVTEYTFGDHAVGADALGPDGTLVIAPRRTRRDTLVQPRVHYVNELLKSVETL